MAGCVDDFPCDCHFRDCFSRSVHDIGQWKTCDMCVCENLDNFTAGTETCVASREGKPMVQCQLSVRSDHSTGCRLILTQQYVIIFSFVGIVLTFMCVVSVYTMGGWYLYKTRMAQEEDDEDDSGSDTTESFMQENPVATKLQTFDTDVSSLQDFDRLMPAKAAQDDVMGRFNSQDRGGKYRPNSRPPQMITVTNDGFDDLDESDDEAPDVERPSEVDRRNEPVKHLERERKETELKETTGLPKMQEISIDGGNRVDTPFNRTDSFQYSNPMAHIRPEKSNNSSGRPDGFSRIADISAAAKASKGTGESKTAIKHERFLPTGRGYNDYTPRTDDQYFSENTSSLSQQKPLAGKMQHATSQRTDHTASSSMSRNTKREQSDFGNISPIRDGQLDHPSIVFNDTAIASTPSKNMSDIPPPKSRISHASNTSTHPPPPPPPPPPSLSLHNPSSSYHRSEIYETANSRKPPFSEAQIINSTPSSGISLNKIEPVAITTHADTGGASKLQALLREKRAASAEANTTARSPISSRVLDTNSLNRSATKSRALEAPQMGPSDPIANIRGMKSATTPLTSAISGGKTKTGDSNTGRPTRQITLSSGSTQAHAANVSEGEGKSSTETASKSRLAQALAERKARAAQQQRGDRR